MFEDLLRVQHQPLSSWTTERRAIILIIVIHSFNQLPIINSIKRIIKLYLFCDKFSQLWIRTANFNEFLNYRVIGINLESRLKKVITCTFIQLVTLCAYKMPRGCHVLNCHHARMRLQSICSFYFESLFVQDFLHVVY